MRIVTILEGAEFIEANDRFNTIVDNTKKFNRNLKIKNIELGNGKKTFFNKKEKILRKVALIHDIYGWGVYITDFGNTK